MNRIILSFLLIVTINSSCRHKQEKADLVVHNARIYSLNEEEAVFEAMAIRDGKIIELGAERDILNKYRADQFLDAGTSPIYPGFIDAHGHLFGLGDAMMNLDLQGTTSWEEIIERLKGYTQGTTGHQKITGRGWDQNDWEQKEFPVNDQLNELFPDIPVFLSRVDGHAAIVNQRALDMAGVKAGDQIEGGEFVVKDGKLTGVLIDNAMDRVSDSLPQPNDEYIEKCILAAQEHLMSLGLSSIADAGVSKQIADVMEKMDKEGKLKLQVYVMIMASPQTLDHYLARDPYKTDRLFINSFKFMGDGALGSRGACLKKPYSDHPGHHGALIMDIEFLKSAARRLHAAGYQMNTHCIGDSTNRLLLSIYKETLGDINDKRWRIEHAQIMDSEDFHFFGEYSIIPSVQPTHATSDMYWAKDRVGEERMKGAYAYQTLLKQNGSIALGTDFPVEDPNPLWTFYAAVFRKDRKGQPKEGFLPEEALTRIQALKGMTIWAAMAQFEEMQKGSLEPGKQADFVLLNSDLLKVMEEDFQKVQVRKVYIRGEQVYSYE